MSKLIAVIKSIAVATLTATIPLYVSSESIVGAATCALIYMVAMHRVFINRYFRPPRASAFWRSGDNFLWSAIAVATRIADACIHYREGALAPVFNRAANVLCIWFIIELNVA